MSNNTEYTYYNCLIQHDDSVSINASPTIARFFETRSVPLIKNPNDYVFSVVRFSVPISLIPLYVFVPNIGGNPNISILSLTLTDIATNINYTQNLIYVPNNTITPPTNAPTTNSEYINSLNYYSIFSIQQVLNMINTAFLNAYNLLPAPIKLILQVPPFISYTNELFVLHTPASYVGVVDIFFNNPLYGLFLNSFDTVIITPFNGTKDIKFNLYDNIINRETINGINYLFFTQDFNTLELWYPATSLLITTGSIPVRYELEPNVSTSNYYNNGGTNSVNNFLNVISDYSLSGTSVVKSRDIIVYNPTAEYRYETLQSDVPINNIDIQLFWRDSYNNLIPLYIPAHFSISIKMLFKKKKI